VRNRLSPLTSACLGHWRTACMRMLQEQLPYNAQGGCDLAVKVCFTVTGLLIIESMYMHCRQRGTVNCMLGNGPFHAMTFVLITSFGKQQGRPLAA